MTASLTFATPIGGLIAFFVVLPLVAFAYMTTRSARARAVLRLAPPSSDGG